MTSGRGILVGLAALALAAPAPASAAFDSCGYDAGTRTVTASLSTSDDGGLYVGAGGEIVSGAVAGGGTQCGAATRANTDRIEVIGRETLDSLTATIDNSGPGGAFRKAGSDDEIAIHVDLGEEPWTYDPLPVEVRTLKLIGTTGADEMRAGRYSRSGTRAINVDAQSDSDADVELSNVTTLDMDGGDGDDFITGLGGTGTREVYSGGLLVLRGSRGDDRIVGNGDGNVIYPGAGYDEVDGGGPGAGCVPDCRDRGIDWVSYEDAPNHVEIGYPHQHDNTDGFGARDDLSNIGGIRGSSHDDMLWNSSVSGIALDGAGGNDEIKGGYQADLLFGGDGDDHLEADPGATFYSVADRLYGGAGNDRLDGGQDPDVLNGGAGDDVLNAGRVREESYEFPHRNWLDGGLGNDRLNGAQTDDTFTFQPAVACMCPPAPVDDVDTIHELPGEGRDTVDTVRGDWWEQDDDVVDLSSTTTELGRNGTRTLRVANAGEAANLEDVSTGAGNDHVTGNAAVNHIWTASGADVVRTRDDVADEVDCGGGDATGTDTAIVDGLDDVDNCATVDRPAPPVAPPPGARTRWLHYDGSAFKVTLPGACVEPSTPLAVRVRRTFVGSSHARLVRATLLLDGDRVARDGTAPFVTRIPAGLSAGEHALKLRLRLQRRHHDAVTRALTATVRTCAAS
jgi:Ca2+-binding RTX toxin-like protein